MRVLVFSALLVGASSAVAAENVYYFDLVNTTQNSIKTFSLAPAGSNMFRNIRLEKPLPAGDSISIATRRSEGGCLRDLRTEFSTGDVLKQRFFNVCEQRKYDVGQAVSRPDKAVERTQP